MILNSATEFFSHFIQPDPRTALLVVLNLVIIEGLLSVDNAAVLATMVMDLPNKDRNRALRIGILFAYIFRGVTLVFAGLLIKITWLKLVASAYLIYLCLQFFYKRIFHPATNAEEPVKVKRRLIPGLNFFWSTVLMVELMDMVFSIDNVFAAVAFTTNIYLVCTGVFIGIIAMRVVAGYFVKLMEKFPFLDAVAFTVIGVLGLRLMFDFLCATFPDMPLCKILHSEGSEKYFSIVTVAIFVLPIITSLLFGIPKTKKQL